MADELITVNWNDQSSTVNTSVGSVGATVISSYRGGNEPVFFYAKQTSRILDYFGIPDTNNTGVAEVLAFNADYPIWVSAPSTGGLFAGVLVTKTGTKPLLTGQLSNSVDDFSFSSISNSELVTQTADGVITNFTLTISDFSHYVAQSIDITVNGTSIAVSASSADPEVLTSASGSGTFTPSTGALDFTFTTAPITGSIIKATYKTNYISDAYFALFDKNPQVSDLKVKCALADATTGSFSVSLYKESRTSKGLYKLLSNWPLTVSTVANTKNGFGENIFINNYLENNDYVVGIANTALTVSTFTEDTASTLMTGGIRGTTSATELATGWTFFQNYNKFSADILFDTTSDTSIPAIFGTLSSSYQKYSSYIYPMANTTSATAITNSESIMTDDKNIAFYWGWGKVYNSYTDSYIASPLTGSVAYQYAQMHDAYNGLAPAYANENGTHGGQIVGRTIKEMFYDADDTAQTLLENARINAIVRHPSLGIMCARERTSQSVQSDYSSIGHTRLANYIASNAIKVLPYQLFKLNDTAHRASVASKLNAIMSPLSAEPYNLVRDFAIKCDAENNNDAVLQAEQFVVSVAWRFTPFAHYIILNLINSAQGTTAEDAIY